MHGLALIYILRDLPGLQAFKVTQHDLHSTTVQVVPGPAWDPACVPRIVEGFRRRLGDAVAVQVETVAAIPAEKSGKFRYIVSHVARGAAARDAAAN